MVHRGVRHKGAKREKHDPVIEWEVPTDMGLLPGISKKGKSGSAFIAPGEGATAVRFMTSRM